MIYLDDYLNHWRKSYGHIAVPTGELTPDMLADAQVIVDRGNQLLTQFGEGREITSGWRPFAVNQLVTGAAVHSNHTRCMAVDLADPDGSLDDWCLDHATLLEGLGLWQEHPAATKGWCHVQSVAPRSGKRVFYP
jgi:hypothetical protein